ncbi:MAG: PAS domain S-box protein, partial [Methanobacteriota archaeon]
DQSYQSLVENSLVGVYIIQDGVFKFVNPRLCQILGYSEGELIGKSVSQLVVPAYKEEVEEKIRQRMTGEVDAIHYSFQVFRKDGGIIDVEVYGSRIIYQGAPAIHGTLLEISERKRDEEFVKKQNRLLEQIAGGSDLDECLDNILHFLESYGKGIHCSVCLVDSSGTCLELKNAPSLPEEVQDAFRNVKLQEEKSCCAQAVLRKKSVITADITRETEPDLRKDVLLKHGYRACWSIPILSAENRVMGTLGMYSREARYPSEIELQLVEVGVNLISIAINKQERERQLRERERWFRSIFETSAIGILLISPEGKLIANNTSFSKLLKYSSFDLAKKSFFDILHPEDRSLNINS